MNLNIHYPLDFAVGFYLALSFFKCIASFAFALLIVELFDTNSRGMMHLLAGCFISDWIRIIYIRPAQKTARQNQQDEFKAFLSQIALQRNACKCHQLVVELFAEPASFKNIVESVSSFAHQIHSELPRFHASKIAPTDP